MLDFNIEPLFREVYRIKKRKPAVNLNFLSDWDVASYSDSEFKAVLRSVYLSSSEQSSKYRYSYEQFELKELIISLLISQSSIKKINSEITISPSSTISIFLAIQSLQAIGIKRYLIFTPLYFSMYETLIKTNSTILFYHLEDEQKYTIDYEKLKTYVREQYIETIILTDPIYSSGIEFSIDDYNKLVNICNEMGCYLIIDYSLGGLIWNKADNFIFNIDKISAIIKCEKFLFIDSPSKRLLLNGIKFSILFGNQNIIDKIDLMAESTYGALNTVQCQLISELYKPINQKTISILCKNNIEAIKNNHALVKSTVLNSEYEIVNTSSGYFSLLNHNSKKMFDVDKDKFTFFMLRKKNIICLTKDKFGYLNKNSFGFRINLNKGKKELLLGVSQSIGVNCSRFH